MTVDRYRYKSIDEHTVSVMAYCPFCLNYVEIVEPIGWDDFRTWTSQTRPLVNDIFPYLSADAREQMMTGICPPCWKETFDA